VVAVSVLVPFADDFDQVKRLIRSLDLQTLPVADFELVLPAGLGQLDALANHRPNLKVVHAADPTQDLLAAADGDFVLAVNQDEAMFPGALAQLRDFAERHGIDAVVGRVVTPGSPVPVSLWADADHLEDAGAVLTDPVGAGPSRLFVRRDAAEPSGSGQLRTAASRVGVLGSHAVIRRDSLAADEAGTTAPTVTVENLDWVDDALHVALRMASDEPTAAGDLRAAVQLAHTGTEETFLVPAEISAQEDGAELRLTAVLAPTRTPAVGQQLAPGCWQVSVLVAAGGESGSPVPVPWMPVRPALIGSTAVVPAPTEGADAALLLDVGPTDHPLVSRPDPDDGTVTESAAGSELVLELGQLHLFRTDGLDGFVALGSLRLPARIRVREGRAQLVAFVTGLAGTSPLSAQLGPGPLRATGLSLRISGVGEMSLVRTPPPAPRPPAAPAKPPTASRPPATQTPKRKRRKKPEPPRTGLVADLRRGVPAPLEPVVKRLAAIPAARRLYRRVTR